MKNDKLSLSDVISSSWGKAKSNYSVVLFSLLIYLLIITVVGVLESGATNIASNNPSGIAIIISLFAPAIMIFRLGVQNLLSIGLTRIFLNIVDGKKAEIPQIFEAEGVFWQYLGASILYGLIIVAGILLLIVPGIYWSIKYQFAMTIVVDRKKSPTEALSISGDITSGYKWWLLLFGIVMALLNLAGLLALGLGLLITIPITLLAHIYVYRTLSLKAKS
ncbi:MAG: hypothetical protein WCH00_00940 [Candidatus Saccharibacteria bacterium]